MQKCLYFNRCLTVKSYLHFQILEKLKKIPDWLFTVRLYVQFQKFQETTPVRTKIAMFYSFVQLIQNYKLLSYDIQCYY